jgi:molecular chaperone GrpE
MSKEEEKDVNSATEEKSEEVLENEEVQASSDESSAEGSDKQEDEELSTEDKISQLEASLEDEKNKALRAHAEMMNFRKRLEKEKSSWHASSVKSTISPLLDPMDNLERALESAQGESDNPGEQLSGLIDGVKMVSQQFQDVLSEKNVTCLDPKGELFDPNEHEAYGQVETDDVEDGHVAMVFRKGYKIGEQLIRTATVQVAKKPQPKED